MDKQINLINDLENAKERFEKLGSKMSKDLERLPKGYLMQRSDGRLFKVISKNGRKEQIRLTKTESADIKTIEALKYKKYIKEALPVLRNWEKNINELLKNVCIYDPLAIEEKMKSQYKGLSNIPVFLEGDINPSSWKRNNYPAMYKEGLIYPSEGGLMTRSKSEAQIASKYESMGWDFEYEPVVELENGRLFRPDFGVLHPFKRKVVYHEHFGMMDDPEYAMNALHKLDEYSNAGIYLGHNLVITSETRQRPLTYQSINELIKKIERM